MAKIFVFGDFNADLVLYLDRLPKAGETLNANQFFQGPGGKGSNQAIAAARLGAEVTFFGAIGNDHYGQIAKSAWADNGVRMDQLITDDAYQTAMALINVDAEGNNTITVHQGANLEVTAEHVIEATDVIADADIVICTLGVAPERVQQVFEIAKANHTTTILNPAPATALSTEMLSLIDYITPNETELSVIVDRDISADNLADAVRELLQTETQTAIVTLGADGAQWVTLTDTAQVPTYEVEVVDTVGAGDAFNAGFAVALAEGKSLAEAMQFANAVAALSVQKIGAVGGMPYREDVDRFLN